MNNIDGAFVMRQLENEDIVRRLRRLTRLNGKIVGMNRLDSKGIIDICPNNHDVLAELTNENDLLSFDLEDANDDIKLGDLVSFELRKINNDCIYPVAVQKEEQV